MRIFAVILISAVLSCSQAPQDSVPSPPDESAACGISFSGGESARELIKKVIRMKSECHLDDTEIENLAAGA